MEMNIEFPKIAVFGNFFDREFTERTPEILDHRTFPWSYISQISWNKSTDLWFFISTVLVNLFLELGDLSTRDCVI